MQKNNFVKQIGLMLYRPPQYDEDVARLYCRAKTSERLYRIAKDDIDTFLSLAIQMRENDVIDKDDPQNHNKFIILLHHNNIIAWKYKDTKMDHWMCMADYNKYAIDTLNHIKAAYLKALKAQKENILLQVQEDCQNTIIL